MKRKSKYYLRKEIMKQKGSKLDRKYTRMRYEQY